MCLHFQVHSKIQGANGIKTMKISTSSQAPASRSSNEMSFQDVISLNNKTTEWRDNEVESNHRRAMEYAHLIKETALDTQRTQLGAYYRYC